MQFWLNWQLYLLAWHALTCQSEYYCGLIKTHETNGASGYFLIDITSKESSAHRLTLDLSNFSTSCDLSQGLTYTINTSWNNTNLNSSSYENCDKAHTGGNYDPSFACGPDSEYFDSECVLLDRTATYGYNYSCSPETYESSNYVVCELGDLSGKHGELYETETNSSVFEISTPEIDYLPPFAYNYKHAQSVFPSWSAVVFSCKADNTPLVCSNLYEISQGTTQEECDSALAVVDDDTTMDDEINWTNLDGFDIFFIVVGAVIFTLSLIFCTVFCWRAQMVTNDSLEKNNKSLSVESTGLLSSRGSVRQSRE